MKSNIIPFFIFVISNLCAQENTNPSGEIFFKTKYTKNQLILLFKERLLNEDRHIYLKLLEQKADIVKYCECVISNMEISINSLDRTKKYPKGIGKSLANLVKTNCLLDKDYIYSYQIIK